MEPRKEEFSPTKRATQRTDNFPHLVDRFASLFSRSLCQHLLHSLLFLQKESSHDARFEAHGAARSPIRTRDSALSLLRGVVFARPDVLDPLQSHFAVTALGSSGGLVHALLLEGTTWSSDSSRLVRPSIVGVASHSRPTIIRHDCK